MIRRNPYVREIPRTWWLKNPWFIKYALREGSSLFFMLFSIELVWALNALLSGPEAWQSVMTFALSPVGIVFHLLCLVASLIHATSWFVLAPKTMDLWLGKHRVPEKLITIAHYLGWGVCSIAIVLIVGGWL